MEGSIRGYPSFGNQYMDMRMEFDAIAESLDNGHHDRHKLKAYHCIQEFHKSMHHSETERIEKHSLEAKEKPRHLWNGEGELTVYLNKLCPNFAKNLSKTSKNIERYLTPSKSRWPLNGAFSIGKPLFSARWLLRGPLPNRKHHKEYWIGGNWMSCGLLTRILLRRLDRPGQPERPGSRRTTARLRRREPRTGEKRPVPS